MSTAIPHRALTLLKLTKMLKTRRTGKSNGTQKRRMQWDRQLRAKVDREEDRQSAAKGDRQLHLQT